MIKILPLTAIITALLLLTSPLTTTAEDTASIESGELWIKINGIESDDGLMIFTLCDSKACHKRKAKPLKKVALTVRKMHYSTTPYEGPEYGRRAVNKGGTSMKETKTSHKGNTHKAEEAGHTHIREYMSLWILQKLPYGEYGVTVYHDLDSNGKLNGKGFGPPKEPYGFSNGARGIFGPPSWKASKFTFNKNVQVIEITVK